MDAWQKNWKRAGHLRELNHPRHSPALHVRAFAAEQDAAILQPLRPVTRDQMAVYIARAFLVN